MLCVYFGGVQRNKTDFLYALAHPRARRFHQDLATLFWTLWLRGRQSVGDTGGWRRRDDAPPRGRGETGVPVGVNSAHTAGPGVLLTRQPPRPPAHPTPASAKACLPPGVHTPADRAVAGEHPLGPSGPDGPSGCFNYQPTPVSLRSRVPITETCQASTPRTGIVSFLLALVFN